jgi:hypothetical protein
LAIVVSKSLSIFRSLAKVVPVLGSFVLAAPDDEEDMLKTVGGFSRLWNLQDRT